MSILHDVRSGIRGFEGGVPRSVGSPAGGGVWGYILIRNRDLGSEIWVWDCLWDIVLRLGLGI